jgi:hypothetical protein
MGPNWPKISCKWSSLMFFDRRSTTICRPGQFMIDSADPTQPVNDADQPWYFLLARPHLGLDCRHDRGRDSGSCCGCHSIDDHCGEGGRSVIS